MRPRRALALLTISLALGWSGLGPWDLGLGASALRTSHGAPRTDLGADLDGIFSDPVLSRALIGIRVESLRSGSVIYQRNSEKLVMPASNMKLFTLAAAVDRLGWDYRWETRLETAGKIENGALRGDLWVIGSGDPTIGAKDNGFAPLFLEWADALAKAGIRRIDGRIIGDDDAFDDTGVGPGWAWDYLDADYAAPSGALSLNENVVTLRLSPGAYPNDAVRIASFPAGHGFEIANGMISGEPGSAPSVSISRRAGSMHLDVSGSIPANGPVVTRTTTVENPTKVFVDAFKLALASRGIVARDGADDGDDVMRVMMVEDRRVLAKHLSAPLAEIAGGFLKPSQNFYGEMILKTIGRVGSEGGAPQIGTTPAGRKAALESLVKLGIPADALVMYDGSGLSRYNYVTADGVVTLLKKVWADAKLRGPFVAALPVGGHDGTLSNRMKDSELDRRVQAKTGSISNVRSLSGYLETMSGERLVFSMIANHFTAPASQIDGVVEKALTRLLRYPQ